MPDSRSGCPSQFPSDFVRVRAGSLHFDRRRVQPSGLAGELVVSREGLDDTDRRTRRAVRADAVRGESRPAAGRSSSSRCTSRTATSRRPDRRATGQPALSLDYRHAGSFDFREGGAAMPRGGATVPGPLAGRAVVPHLGPLPAVGRVRAVKSVADSALQRGQDE